MKNNSIDLTSLILQILSLQILFDDFNNTDLMYYLKHQDELLDKIINQNIEIIELLKGGTNGN